MTIVKTDYGSVGARERHIPRGLANTHPIFVERAEGTRIWDTDGKEYLDFTSGIGVLNTGHRHPAVVRAVRDQLDRLMHTCFQVTMYEPYVELAARLSALVGSADTHKAVLFTTGAEAIENAVKIARAHTRRSGVIAFSGGFHGRSLLALTMTASSPAYRQNFGPFAADVYHTPYPDEYRGWTTARAIEALEELFSTEVMPEQIAAVVIEPELGEGGFIPAPAPFMQQLRAITRAARHRPGRRRGAERFRTNRPDVRLSARRDRARSRGDGQEPRGRPAAVRGRRHGRDHGRAAAGRTRRHLRRQPAGLRLGAGGARHFRRGRTGRRVRRRWARRFARALLRLQARVPQIGDVRGLGAMLAIELVSDPATKAPDAELAQRIIDSARERGLLLLKCGPHKNVVRLLPPLTASSEEVTAGTARLEAAVLDARG